MYDIDRNISFRQHLAYNSTTLDNGPNTRTYLTRIWLL